VDSYRTGARIYPEGFDPESGIFDEVPVVPHQFSGSASFAGSRVEISALVQRICQVTGSSLCDIQRSQRGRFANPLRPFAAWALATSSDATLNQIGHQLGMSGNQVGKVVRRLKANSSSNPLVRRWMKRWNEEIAQ
jgi:hypothetical protein